MSKKKAELSATVMAVAMLGYSANVKLSEAMNATAVSWDKCDKDVRKCFVELAAFAIEEPGAGVEKLHQKFLLILKAHGWKEGDVVDAKRKLHTLMRPYDALTVAERSYYRVLQAIAGGVKKYQLVVLDTEEADLPKALEEKDVKIAKLEESIVTQDERFEELKAEIAGVKADKQKLQLDYNALKKGSVAAGEAGVDGVNKG